jgi:hypothetical protein
MIDLPPFERRGDTAPRLAPLKSARSGFSTNLVLFALCAGVAGYFGWPLIKAYVGPDAFPQQNASGHIEPYDAFGFRGDPKRVQRWSDGQTPQQRGYSEYYPREGRQAPAAPYRMDRRPGTEDGDREAPPIAGRRAPETTGRGRPGGCWDTVQRRMVDPSFCDRAERAGRR